MGAILTSYYKQRDADSVKSSETETKKTEKRNETPEKVRTSKKSISYYPPYYKKRKNTKKNK